MTLPPCHSRKVIIPVPDVYFCTHPEVEKPSHLVKTEDCAACRLWEGPPPKQPRPFWITNGSTAPRIDCRHLGTVTGTRDCPSCCRGSVKIKVYSCGHPNHSETTLNECRDCPDYQTADRERLPANCR